MHGIGRKNNAGRCGKKKTKNCADATQRYLAARRGRQRCAHRLRWEKGPTPAVATNAEALDAATSGEALGTAKVETRR